MIASNYSSVKGFFVDATMNRYGTSSYVPAWQGGAPLSDGVGILFNLLSYTPITSSNWYTYYAQFYLTKIGNLQEIDERVTILTKGGYLCKKFQSAPTPSTVVYNIGFCFPSLPSNGSCPSGWMKYTPNSTPFCYLTQLSYDDGVDEQFRNCQGIGADLIYLDSSPEYSWLYTKSLMNNNFYSNDINAHRFRYGPNGLPNGPNSFTYSNGIGFSAFTYSGPGPTGWGSGEPDDSSSYDGCMESWGTYSWFGWNDHPCGLTDTATSFSTASTVGGACKRRLCGMNENFLISYVCNNFLKLYFMNVYIV